MPISDELAEITAAGSSYRDWVSVMVRREYGAWMSDFSFTAAEPGDGNGKGWGALKLKPGDAVQIRLAGEQVIDGYIVVRQPAYDARQHQVTLSGGSLTGDLVDSSVEVKGGQFRGYSFKAIAEKVLKPFPSKLIIKNPPPGFDRPFENVIVHHGETVREFLERLGRLRGIIFTDDEQGNLVGRGSPESSSAATLVEGKNILAAAAVIRNDAIYGKIAATGQRRGNDDEWGKKVAQVQATATNPSVRPWRLLKVIAEEPVTSKDVQTRADYEMAKSAATAVNVKVVVQGWKGPNGKLWVVGDTVTVRSPMLFPEPDGKMDLAIKVTTFAQDSAAGTTTTLELCLPQALSIIPDPGVKGAVPNMLDNPKGQPATPDPVDGN